MNQTPITFDDLTPAERIVYLLAAQRLLDGYEPAIGNTSTSNQPDIKAIASLDG